MNKLQSVVTREVVMALRRIIRAVDLHSHALAARCGLTGPQLMVLKELVDGPPCSVGNLARAVHVSQATVTGILDRLEERDAVSRTRSRDDRRRVEVAATDRGRQLVAAAPPLLQEHFVRAFSQLPSWEQTQILSSLQRLVALMEAGELTVSPILATEPVAGEPGPGVDLPPPPVDPGTHG